MVATSASNPTLTASAIVTVPPPAGSPGLSFGKNGKVTTAPGFGSDDVQSVAVQTDGKIVTGGVAQTMAIQSDGKILVAGDSYTGETVEFTLMRYGFDWKLDPSFGKEGKTRAFFSAGTGGKVLLRPDGSIFAAGTVFDPNNATTDFVIGLYDNEGTFQGGNTVGFSGNGLQNQDFLSALALQPNGKILTARSTLTMNNTGNDFDFALARFNDDGTLDTLFGTNGTVITTFVSGDTVHTDHDFARAITLQPDGKIILAGSSVDGLVTKFALVRYNSDGSLDIGSWTEGTINSTIDAGNNGIFDLAIQPDGKIVAAGYSNAANSDFAIARYNTDGTFDTTFGLSGIRIFPVGQNIDYVNAVAIQPDGKIIVAGGASIGTRYEFALARFWP